jgi:hypothetical protein
VYPLCDRSVLEIFICALVESSSSPSFVAPIQQWGAWVFRKV